MRRTIYYIVFLLRPCELHIFCDKFTIFKAMKKIPFKLSKKFDFLVGIKT